MHAALIALCLILAAFSALAKPEQAKPDTDIVPDRKAIEVQENAVPCLRQSEQQFIWWLEDRHGNIVMVGSQTVRLRC